MNLDAKILIKILANHILNALNSSVTMTRWGLLWGCKDGSAYANRSMCYTKKMIIWSKNHMIISTDTGKSIWQNSSLFLIKPFNKLGTEEMYINTVKAIYDIPTVNITFNGEKLKAFLLISGQDKDVHSCHFYLT